MGIRKSGCRIPADQGIRRDYLGFSETGLVC